MRNIRLYEDYQNASDIKYTEEEMDKILLDFNASEFFELDIEKNVKVELKDKITETTEDGNKSEGRIGYWLELVSIKMLDGIYDKLEKMFSEFKKTGDPDLNDLKNDLVNIGLDDGKAFTWTEIRARIKNLHNLDRSTKWVVLEQEDLAVGLEPGENMQHSSEFKITLYPKEYNGKLVFDSATFSDDLLDDLFYDSSHKKN